LSVSNGDTKLKRGNYVAKRILSSAVLIREYSDIRNQPSADMVKYHLLQTSNKILDKRLNAPIANFHFMIMLSQESFLFN
jgi:hypothetical protein